MNEGAHYRRLGVSSNASPDEIRAAYRNAARRFHPDARAARGTAGSDDEMAAVNEAWRVLSDPVSRARYDADLGLGNDSAVSAAATVPPRVVPFVGDQRPARFPWRFVVLFVVAAAIVILVVGALTDPGEPTPIDNVVRVGSCVTIDSVRLEVDEVACTDAHDGVVEQVVPFDASCPFSLVGYRDRQGMGIACVRTP
jgi:molecular chaperone DnaJ